MPSMGMQLWQPKAWMSGMAAAAALGLTACTSPSAPPDMTPVTITVTSTVTESPDSRVDEVPTADSKTSSPIAKGSEDEHSLNVDPERFLGPDPHRNDGYFFLSPSRNLSCGLLVGDEGLSGCQASSLVVDLPECDAPQEASAPVVAFVRGEPVETFCVTNPRFWPNAPVLDYGHQITVDGITCTSRITGVTCLEESTGVGFSAAREGFRAIGSIR